MDTQLFRGVHYEICCYDKDGNEWLVHSTKKANVGEKIGLDFEPEAFMLCDIMKQKKNLISDLKHTMRIHHE